MNEENKNIAWYPGHMVKTKKEIREKIKLIDVVVQIVDARIPFSTNIIDIKDYILDKIRIIVFSKFDLCDKKETDKWIEYYENLGCKVILADLKNGNDYKEIITTVAEFMTEVNIKRKKRGLLPKKAKVLVVGVPNVGKSTLINKLVKKNVREVANKPGVTKSLSTIKINKEIDLVDTPGILYPKIESKEVALNLSSFSNIKETIIPLEEVGIHILTKLNLFYKPILKEFYNLDSFSLENIEEDYKKISDFRSVKKSNNEIDYEKINYVIINDIKSERIKGITFDRM